MKFRFNFEKLLQYRKLRKDLKTRELAQAQHELDEERERLHGYYDSIKQSRQRIFSLVQGEIVDEEEPVVKSVQQGEDFIDGQMVRVALQREVIREKINNVEQKQEALRQTAIEHKVLDTLRENRLEMFKKEEKKKETKAIDDLVVMRFNKGER